MGSFQKYKCIYLLMIQKKTYCDKQDRTKYPTMLLCQQQWYKKKQEHTVQLINSTNIGLKFCLLIIVTI